MLTVYIQASEYKISVKINGEILLSVSKRSMNALRKRKNLLYNVMTNTEEVVWPGTRHSVHMLRDRAVDDVYIRQVNEAAGGSTHNM